MTLQQLTDRGIMFQMNVLATQMIMEYREMAVDGVMPRMVCNIHVQERWRENQVTQFYCKKIGCIVKTYNN